LLVPIIYRTEYSFSRPQDVTLSYEVRQGVKNANYAVYPVRIEGPGSDTLTIHEPGDHDKARRLAEEIAKYLDFGIRDRSSAEVVVREAGTLDQPLRERMRRAGRSVPLPAQTPGARALLNYGGTRAPTTIEIPPTPVGECLRSLLIGMAIAGAMAIVFELVLRYKGNLEFGVATLCIFVPALLVLPLLLIRAAVLRERLVVSTEEIVVTRRDIFGTWTTRLAGAEIEEVALIQAGYLRAYGSGGESRVEIQRDRGSFQVGEALSNQEVRWLRDVLIHVLTVRFE
jgi:hypothetical protein